MGTSGLACRDLSSRCGYDAAASSISTRAHDFHGSESLVVSLLGAGRPDRAHFDGAERGGRAVLGPLDGRIEIRHVDQVVTAELLLGFGIGAGEHNGLL